ncbi:MAG: NADH-quinone oxidoreductase subunit N, partial [Phycisphaerae bacterium]
MNSIDMIALLPMIILAALPVVVMLELSFYRSHKITLIITLLGLTAAFILLSPALHHSPRQVTSLLIIDGYAIFYTGLILAATFTVALLSYGYLEKRQTRCEEFYILLTLAALGSAVLASSSHFASFFLGLEILSVSLYGLIAYVREDHFGIEAGIKYLILAATSAAFLLFGMAMIYAESGTMEFARIASGNIHGAFYVTALALIIVGIGFKLALVPFHLWTPDVYQGAPAPVTAFIATVSKGAMFALLLRFFSQAHIQNFNSLMLVFTLIAIASMFVGNWLALLQNNVKRILAYSSISHLGYLLVALLASGSLAVTAVTFYLVTYFVTT